MGKKSSLLPFREQTRGSGVSPCCSPGHLHRGEGLACAGTGRNQRMNQKLKCTEIRGGIFK